MAETFDEHLRRALQAVGNRVRLELDQSLSRAAADLNDVLNVERAGAAALVASERAAGRAAAIGAVERTLHSVRELDGATSLSEALHALASGGRGVADRFALLLVHGDSLRGWTSNGYDGLADGAETALPASSVLTDVVTTGSPLTVPAGVSSGRPPFALDSTRALVAVPLVLDGNVIAVLCGEPQPDTADVRLLAATLELLARHAARVLELLTTRRLAQLAPPVPGRDLAHHAPSAPVHL